MPVDRHGCGRNGELQADVALEPVTGIEPATSALQGVLYQLSYTGEVRRSS